jgi:hypothetical protein
MKRLPLWQWGGICIFAGVFSNLLMTLMIQAGNMRRAEERAAQLGGACAGGLFIVLGIVLIVWHFVRRKRS